MRRLVTYESALTGGSLRYFGIGSGYEVLVLCDGSDGRNGGGGGRGQVLGAAERRGCLLVFSPQLYLDLTWWPRFVPLP